MLLYLGNIVGELRGMFRVTVPIPGLAWGWINMAARVFPGDDNPLAAFPNIKRWFELIEDRPAASRARLVSTDHPFKKERDEEALRALFPSNY